VIAYGKPATVEARFGGQGGKSMKRKYLAAIPLALLLLAVLAPSAFADSTDLSQSIAGKLDPSVGINTMWVIVAGALVMFMQAGFAFLEIGFSRG
jgi:Amt family ammonium transporter